MTPKPYIYRLTNKKTREFYIGFRCANKVEAQKDLGVCYFTSSKTVRKDFSEYEIDFIQEFDTADEAYASEQQLIKENFLNPLILNKHWQDTKTYSMLGFKRPDLGDLNRVLKSKPKEERNYLCACCGNTILKIEFCHKPKKEKAYCDATCRNRFVASLKPKVEKKKKPKKKRVSSWNKGIPNKLAKDNAIRGSAKQSKTATGRKRYYLSEDDWTWQYQIDGEWCVRNKNGNYVPIVPIQ